MPDEEIKYIISGTPVSKRAQHAIGIRVYVPAPGSIIERCEKCRVKVWIGPKQQQCRTDTSAPIWCIGCVAKERPGTDQIKNLGGIGGSYYLDGGKKFVPRTPNN